MADHILVNSEGIMSSYSRKVNRTCAIAAGLSILALCSCAQTDAMIGNHQNAAYTYRSSAQGMEKEAKKEADLQNHIEAAKMYIDAARKRLSSAQEYQKIGNPVWAKNMFDKSGADLTTAANEIRAAQSPPSN